MSNDDRPLPETSTEYHAIGLTLHIDTWRCRAIDQIDDSRMEISASGYLSFDRDWEMREILISDGRPIVEVRCEMALHMRKSNAEVEPIRVAEGDHWTGIFEALKPIGSLTYCAPSDNPRSDDPRLDEIVAVFLGISADHFNELTKRYLAGLELPGFIYFRLPHVMGRRVESARSARAFLMDPKAVGHVITRAIWSYGDQQAESRWLSDTRVGDLQLIARFIEGLAWKNVGWKFGYQEFNRLVGELLASALQRVRNGEISANEINEWLEYAYSIADDFWDQLLSAEQQTRKARKDFKAKPRWDKGEKPVALPWFKRLPMEDFQQGYDSHLWTSINQEALHREIDRYLGSTLDSPYFEWLCVDILTYAEVRGFGESIKQKAPLSLRHPLGMKFSYFSSGANLNRMQAKGLFVDWLLFAAKWLALLGLPGYVGYLKWTEGEQDLVMIGGAMWIACLVAWPFVRKSLGLGAARDEFNKALKQEFELFAKMSAAYRAITWYVPPATVRRVLDDVRQEGAVWDGRSMSLLAKAEIRDPISWGRNESEMWSQPFSRLVANQLDSAYREKIAAKKEMDLPDFDKDVRSA